MKSSRRMKRMGRNRKKAMPLNLTSLMDVFTILVFFLLVNSATTEVLETPKTITLPASVVEEKPRETVVIFVSTEEITVQGESVVRIADVVASGIEDIAPIGERLQQIGANVIGLKTRQASEGQEITILADRGVPFSIVRRVMSTCTNHGYERISLAVLQKAPQLAKSE